MAYDKNFDANRLYRVVGRDNISRGLERDPDTGALKRHSGGRTSVEHQVFADSSDALANNKKAIIGFYHLPSKQSVNFKAFLTAFNETFNIDWTEEKVFGRSDPIFQYRGTGRALTIGWKIPAATLSEGLENLAHVQRFLKFQYPFYNDSSGGGNTLTIAQSPLVRLQIMNMVTSGHANGGKVGVIGASGKVDSKISYESNSTKRGLLGAITSVSVNYNLDTDEGGGWQGEGAIIPKLIDLTIDFKPIHEETMGWSERDGKTVFGAGSKDSLFPYAIEQYDESAKGHGINAAADLAKRMQSMTKEHRDQQTKDFQREQAHADLLNAQARYSGLFGSMMAKADIKRADKGRSDMDPYRASAVRGLGYQPEASDAPSLYSGAGGEDLQELAQDVAKWQQEG